MQEFSAISVSTYSDESLADKLTAASAEGWTVVSIVPVGTSTITAFLSRPAGSAPDSGADDAHGESAADTALVVGNLDESSTDTTGEPTADTSADNSADNSADTAADSPVAAATEEPSVSDWGASEERAHAAESVTEAPGETLTESSTQSSTESPASDAWAAESAVDAGDTGSDDTTNEIVGVTTDDAPAEPAGETPSSLADELAAILPQIDDESAGESTREAAPDTSFEPVAEAPAGSSEPVNEAAGWGLGASTDTSQSGAADTASTDTPATDTGAQTTAAAGAAPQGWYDDPSGRFQYRYWDGTQWTEHVSRDGQQYVDPPVA